MQRIVGFDIMEKMEVVPFYVLRGEGMWIYIVIAVIVFILFYAVAIYNRFIKLNNQLKEAFSTMDVYLKKRWDLIPNLVETVKGYARYEQDTLKEVVELRNSTYHNMTEDQKMKTNEKLSQNIDKIMAIAEGYPELKASEGFRELSNQLTKVEEDIANSRKYYNGIVRMYNDKVQMFPGNIFAGLFGYRVKAMFEAGADERENVKVSL